MFEVMGPLAVAVLGFLGANALYASLVAGPVIVLDRWLARRANRLRAILWGLVLVRLLLPTDLRAPWSLDPILLGQSLLGGQAESFASAELDGPSRRGSQPGNVDHNQLPLALFLIWATGALSTFVLFSVRRRRISAVPHRTVPASVTQRVAYWARRLGMPPPPVFASPVQTAMAIGVFRPRVILPETNVHGEASALDAVIVHELSHLQRRHDHRLLFGHLVRAIYFFHPVAHLALRRMTDAHERVCDEAVLGAGISKQRYARLLLTTLVTPRHQLLVPSLALRTRHRIAHVLSMRRGRESAAVRLPVVICMMSLLPAVALSPPPETPSRIFQQAVEWQHPLPGARMSSGFGMRRHPETGERVLHTGVDLVAPRGTPVLAAASGVVRVATTDFQGQSGWGTVIVLDHTPTIASYYGHLDELLVEPGQRVTAGTRIGSTGLTGYTNGPHLHFEVWRENAPTRPDSVIDFGAP